MRELENGMERAVALARGSRVEVAVLQLNDRNQTLTAQQLQIGSATLYRKLKAYGLMRKPG